MAKNWLEYSQDYPVDKATADVRLLGRESDPSDLGVAETHYDVNHRRFNRALEPISTLYRGEPDEIRRLIDVLRFSESGNWPLIRSLLRKEQVDPSQAAAVGIGEWRTTGPQEAEIVTADHRVFIFSDGSSPVDDPSKPAPLEPALREAPPRADWSVAIELGFQLLEEEAGQASDR